MYLVNFVSVSRLDVHCGRRRNDFSTRSGQGPAMSQDIVLQRVSVSVNQFPILRLNFESGRGSLTEWRSGVSVCSTLTLTSSRDAFLVAVELPGPASWFVRKLNVNRYFFGSRVVI